ncbi:MAG: hypothetical protein ABFC80_05475 [Coriobacteriales bacterium]
MTDIERIAHILSDGRWHSSEELADSVCIDYRSRLTEMRRRGARIEARKMPRKRHDGRTRYSNDWRDLDALDALRQEIREQVEAYRVTVPTNRTRVSIETRAGRVMVLGGRLRLLTPDAMTDEIMHALGCDSTDRVTGVRT